MKPYPPAWTIAPTYRHPTIPEMIRRLERLLAERYFR